MSNFRYRTASIISIVGLAFLFVPTQAAHSESYAFVEVSFDSSFAKGGVYEYYGALVQQKNGAQTRALTSRPTNGNFKFTVPISDDPWTLYLSILEPGAEKTNEAFQGFYPQKNNAGVTALRVKSIKIDKDMTLTVKIPVSQKKISLKVVDAAGNSIANSFASASLTGKYSFTQSGLNWELETAVHANGENTSSATGIFQYYFYEETSFSLKVWDKGRSTEATIPKSIKVSKDLEVVMCLPLNFPAGVRTLSSECLQVQMDQELQAAAKVIADKAAAENAASELRISAAKSKYSELNSEIDRLIKQFPSKKSEIELYKKKITLFERINQVNIATVELNLSGIESKLVAMKSVYGKIARTIICIKGKLTKKVTDVTPKCPTGYKKK
jgi:hypothetical protein